MNRFSLKTVLEKREFHNTKASPKSKIQNRLSSQSNIQTNALGRLRGNKFVLDRRNCRLRILRVRLNLNRLDGDPRFPLRQRFGDPVADQLPRRRRIRFKQKSVQTAAEIRKAQAFIEFGQQNHFD